MYNENAGRSKFLAAMKTSEKSKPNRLPPFRIVDGHNAPSLEAVKGSVGGSYPVRNISIK